MTDPTPPVTPTAAPMTILELPYHRLYRAQPTYRWWRPLVAIVMTVVFFFAVSFAVAIPAFVVLVATGSIDLTSVAASQEELTALLLPDMARPWTLIFGLGAIILTLPLVPVALRIAGIRPVGVKTNILHSVLMRLRWNWLLIALAISAVVWFGTTAFQVALGFALGDQLYPFTNTVGTYLISLLIVILLVPLQAATEEYLYRGVLLQSVGAWVRWAPVTILVSAVVFAFSHAYDPWGLVQVGIMGVVFAWMTIRTGGLEAGIAFHTVNNIGSFALIGTGMFSPDGGTGMTTETGGPIAVVWLIVTVAIWVAAIEFAARRRGIERLSRIGVPTPPAGMLPPYGS